MILNLNYYYPIDNIAEYKQNNLIWWVLRAYPSQLTMVITSSGI